MTSIITDISLAVNEIVNGNVIALPTETVYGLGANALDEKAVLKIFEAKDRPRFNPLIVHVNEVSDFDKYGADIPEDVYKLAEKFSPGPLTFIVKKKKIIPDIVTAGNDSVGLRIPSHKIFREVLRRSGFPIAAPSANKSGNISPTCAEDVIWELNCKINYILDGGQCEVGIESTVLNFAGDSINILRFGSVTKEDIEKIIGKINDRGSEKLISPGLLKSHYAPVTPLYLLSDPKEINDIADKKTGILDLSLYKNLKEAALNLYSDLRKLDKMNYDFLVYNKMQDDGLGTAINDRLERASSGTIKNGKIVTKK